MADPIIEALSAPFALGQHEYRKQGKGDDVTGYLTYVGIEHAIGRFNEVIGSGWAWTVVSMQTIGDPAQPSIIVHGRISYTDEDGNQQHRDGLGAAQFTSRADDLDKVVKSAQAEAFKKASHQFGMAAYLWDKGLADQIAVELLRSEGRQWEAKYRPKQISKGNEVARAILGDIKSGDTGPKQQAQPAAKPKAEGMLDGDPDAEAWADLLRTATKLAHGMAPEPTHAEITDALNRLFAAKEKATAGKMAVADIIRAIGSAIVADPKLMTDRIKPKAAPAG